MICDDEVSCVMQQFQSKPALTALGPTTTFKSDTKSSKAKRRNFSCVQYSKKNDSLRLTFRHDRLVLLRFEVQCRKPYNVSCLVPYGNDDDSQQLTDEFTADIARKVKELCLNLSNQNNGGNTSSKAHAEAKSLFLTVSKLLLELNKLPSRKCSPTERDTQHQSDLLRNIISAQLSSSSSISNKTFGDVLDLELLLLRYAAGGKHATTFCQPIPDELDLQGLVYATTFLSSREFCRHNHATPGRSSLPPPKNQQQANLHRRRCLSRQEQELTTFLLSLSHPIEQTSVQKRVSSSSSAPSSSSSSSSIMSSKNRIGRTIKITLCWDLQCYMRGDESPRFIDLAAKYGTTSAYHGTQMDKVWSIVNCGFCNLSDTRFAQNGSMLGGGVYFSTSEKVASFFADSNNKSVNPGIWRHQSVVNLLGLGSVKALDEYIVRCFPVFESRIISPPPVQPTTTKTNGTAATAADTPDSRGLGTTRRKGTYLVVPDPQDVRICKLYLTFELEKKRDFKFLFPFLLMATLGIVFYRYFLLV